MEGLLSIKATDGGYFGGCGICGSGICGSGTGSDGGDVVVVVTGSKYL